MALSLGKGEPAYGAAFDGLVTQQPWLCNGDASRAPEFCVTATPVNARGKPPIDNNPAPSYLSLNLGRLRFAGLVRVEFARKVPQFRSAGSVNPAAAA